MALADIESCFVSFPEVELGHGHMATASEELNGGGKAVGAEVPCQASALIAADVRSNNNDMAKVFVTRDTSA